ncbi:MAG: hypothetical protein HY735_21485 [Verrucomicrobia bacterium]|nr:hypothetical protein [Verrucomicrobiota bacterium]
MGLVRLDLDAGVLGLNQATGSKAMVALGRAAILHRNAAAKISSGKRLVLNRTALASNAKGRASKTSHAHVWKARIVNPAAPNRDLVGRAWLRADRSSVADPWTPRALGANGVTRRIKLRHLDLERRARSNRKKLRANKGRSDRERGWVGPRSGSLVGQDSRRALTFLPKIGPGLDRSLAPP